MLWKRILTALAAVFVLSTASNASAFASLLNLSNGSDTMGVAGQSANISATPAATLDEDFSGMLPVDVASTSHHMLTSPAGNSLSGTGLFAAGLPSFTQLLAQKISIPAPFSAPPQTQLQGSSFAPFGDYTAPLGEPSFGLMSAAQPTIPLPGGMWLLLVDGAWMGALGFVTLAKRSRNYA